MNNSRRPCLDALHSQTSPACKRDLCVGIVYTSRPRSRKSLKTIIARGLHVGRKLKSEETDQHGCQVSPPLQIGLCANLSLFTADSCPKNLAILTLMKVRQARLFRRLIASALRKPAIYPRAGVGSQPSGPGTSQKKTPAEAGIRYGDRKVRM